MPTQPKTTPIIKPIYLDSTNLTDVFGEMICMYNISDEIFNFFMKSFQKWWSNEAFVKLNQTHDGFVLDPVTCSVS